ncbi:hypothetical protein T492DRAFT_1073676 [Pavlovales sp. CCMP2436]|nr:hypothetical protein T492DRAFT_1073676 [Pavlovales sp. CCMP2436]
MARTCGSTHRRRLVLGTHAGMAGTHHATLPAAAGAGDIGNRRVAAKAATHHHGRQHVGAGAPAATASADAQSPALATTLAVTPVTLGVASVDQADSQPAPFPHVRPPRPANFTAAAAARAALEALASDAESNAHPDVMSDSQHGAGKGKGKSRGKGKGAGHELHAGGGGGPAQVRVAALSEMSEADAAAAAEAAAVADAHPEVGKGKGKGSGNSRHKGNVGGGRASDGPWVGRSAPGPGPSEAGDNEEDGACSAEYADPGGEDKYFCECKCCHKQCGLSRFCAPRPEPPAVGSLSLPGDVASPAGAAPFVGNPCAGDAETISSAYKVVGNTCVQVCLPVALKNSAAREGLTFGMGGQGWCGEAGFGIFVGQTLHFHVRAYVFTTDSGPSRVGVGGSYGSSVVGLATSDGSAEQVPGGGITLPASMRLDGAALPALPTPAASVASDSPVASPQPSPAPNPCLEALQSDPSVLLDAIKVSGRSCTQVCLKASLAAEGAARGVSTGNGDCLEQGFLQLVTSGSNGGTPWFIYTDPDNAVGIAPV